MEHGKPKQRKEEKKTQTNGDCLGTDNLLSWIFSIEQENPIAFIIISTFTCVITLKEESCEGDSQPRTHTQPKLRATRICSKFVCDKIVLRIFLTPKKEI